MVTLRHDMKQWLIYEEEPVTATVRALEAAAMGMTGQSLATHPDLKVRAIGTMLRKLADVRIATLIGEGGDSATAADHVALILNWLNRPNLDPPAESLDEFHAALFWLDGRLNDAGTGGDGWYRLLARGE